MYFFKENSMLKRFEMVDFDHVARIRNQEANDFAQVASGYTVAKKELKCLIEVKDKLVSTSVIWPELSMQKLVGAEELPEFCEIFETFAIGNIASRDWWREIVEFLRDPTRMTGRKKNTGC